MRLNSMEKLFRTYQNYEPSKVCFLNSYFVDQVLGEYKNYSKKYMVCTINDNGVNLDTSGIRIVKDGPDSLIRLRIHIIVDGKSSYHINLLIIDHLYKTIKRFEPLNDFEMSESINHVLINRFSKSLPDYTFEEYDFHPNVLVGAIETNLDVRPEEDWKELKGRAVVDE